NPRDGLYRSGSITGKHPNRDLTLVMELQQEAWSFDPTDPTTSLRSIRLGAGDVSFGVKLATWQALSQALAALEWKDITLISSPQPILDEAVAAGENAIADRLRSEITAAWIEEAKNPE